MHRSPLSEDDIRFVDQLVRQAGKVALDMRQDVAVRHKTSPSDLVTDADIKLSHMILEALEKRFPEDLMVSEEGDHPVVEKADVTAPVSDRIWLIDPIDGTQNYVQQDGQWSTMIGLLIDGKPFFGWIYQPTTDTVFYGGPEHGAFKAVGNAAPKRYEVSRGLHDQPPIRLMMGWSDRKKSPWMMQLPEVRFVQSDSMGLKIIKILEDRADIFVSLTGRVKLWDTAAPAAIALGAQLEVGTTDGDSLPYPVPNIQHGSSVIIGRPGAISWADKTVRSQRQQKTVI